MKFWMVYVEGNRMPEYKHEGIVAARTEAARLAGLNPGKKVYVLESVAHCAMTAVQWQHYPVGEIPF